MRAALVGIAAALLIATTALGGSKLTPSEIQATFFNGEPFTASTPQGVRYKMTFTPDGKMTREPVGKTGAKSEGTWKLSKDGYCTTWKGAPQNCFGVLNTADNKWSIMRGTLAIATWSK
ncbi:MAG TPA: hypothetical protein VEK73_02550 [Xanthobacteraceae bacterium]|nr:hypothetical protein [Xanthobacteraceae bacterium]